MFSIQTKKKYDSRMHKMLEARATLIKRYNFWATVALFS